MKYTIDTHTHTLVSGHAYNTIDEMAAYAAGIGVTHLAICLLYTSDAADE